MRQLGLHLRHHVHLAGRAWQMHGELHDQPQAVLQQRGTLRRARAPREDAAHALRRLRLAAAVAAAFAVATRATAACGTARIGQLLLLLAAGTAAGTAAAAAAAIAAGIAAAVLASTIAIASATAAVSAAAASVGGSEDLKWASKDVRDRSLKTESGAHPFRFGVAVVGVDSVRRERAEARPQETQVAKGGERSVERVRVASLVCVRVRVRVRV